MRSDAGAGSINHTCKDGRKGKTRNQLELVPAQRDGIVRAHCQLARLTLEQEKATLSRPCHSKRYITAVKMQIGRAPITFKPHRTHHVQTPIGPDLYSLLTRIFWVPGGTGRRGVRATHLSRPKLY